MHWKYCDTVTAATTMTSEVVAQCVSHTNICTRQTVTFPSAAHCLDTMHSYAMQHIVPLTNSTNIRCMTIYNAMGAG